MSGTAYLTQPRTPDGRWDRTGRTGPAGVRLDLAEEADVAYVLDRIRAAGARRIATLAYVADRRDLAEEFEANTFEFVYERATAADPDHPAITAGEVSRIIDGSWARHVHHMRTDSLHTRMSRGNSHLMRAWAAYAAAARDAQTRLGRPLSEAEHDQLAQVHARRAGTAMDIRRTGVAACHSYEDLTDRQTPSCPGAEEQWAAQADRRADERFEPPDADRPPAAPGRRLDRHNRAINPGFPGVFLWCRMRALTYRLACSLVYHYRLHNSAIRHPYLSPIELKPSPRGTRVDKI